MATVNPLRTVAAISLFTEDLAASKAFYTRVFEATVVFEDAESCSVRFNNVILNLLASSAAGELVGGSQLVAQPGAGCRCQFSVWVDDVDAEVARLRARGVEFLVGPETKPWGKRIASFRDPAGHSWEVAQDV